MFVPADGHHMISPCLAWLIKCAGRTASSVPRAAMHGRCAEKHTPSSARLPPADLGDGMILHASKLPPTVWFWAPT